MQQLSALQRCEEPSLSFNSTDHLAVSPHPLKGIHDFGPYTKELLSSQMDSIRIGVIAPTGGYKVIRSLIQELKSTHSPRERKNYLVEYPGFRQLFGVDVNLIEEDKCVEIDLDVISSRSEQPHITLSEELTKAIRAILKFRHEFDVLMINLPTTWSSAFESTDENFDLHDFLKAFTANNYLPSQIIRENSTLTYPDRCSVMWRLSLALYTKAGGVPWKLANTDEEVAFIGLSYATKYNRTTNKFEFITCCSQVFDSDGTGLEFLAYETDEISHSIGENPFLSRAEMRKVMSRSLSLYQKRHAGKTPKKIIVHKSTHFTSDEVEGCFDAFPETQHLELLQVVQSTKWRGINIPQKKVIGSYPINRNSYVALDGRELLLWTQGSVNINGRPFYKEARGIPSPLRIVRFAGSGGWHENANSILGLTKMNWNHDGLYDRLPVTLGYASILATTLKRFGRLQNRPYEFRFFM